MVAQGCSTGGAIGRLLTIPHHCGPAVITGYQAQGTS